MVEEKTLPEPKTDYVADILDVIRSPNPTQELELALDFIESKGLGHDYLKYRDDFQHDRELQKKVMDAKAILDKGSVTLPVGQLKQTRCPKCGRPYESWPFMDPCTCKKEVSK